MACGDVQAPGEVAPPGEDGKLLCWELLYRGEPRGDAETEPTLTGVGAELFSPGAKMIKAQAIGLLQYVHHGVVVMAVGVGVGVREGIHVSKNQVSPGPFS